MSRKLILIGAVLAGILFAVGCGPTPTSGGATPPSGGREGNMLDDAKRKAEDTGKKVTEVAGELKGKAKDLYEEANKEIDVVKKKIEDLKKKAAEGGDAGPRAEAAKMLNEAEPKLKAVMDVMTKSFAPDKLKDLMSDDSVTKLRESLMKVIGELKKSVGL